MSAASFAVLDKNGIKANLDPAQSESFARSLEHPIKGATILVVDDSHSIRLALEDGLLQEGYKVLTAENGRKALVIIENIQPDFIVSDVYMPEMSGLELCSALHENPGKSALSQHCATFF